MSERVRTEQAIDTGWRFHLGDSKYALNPGLDDTDWQDVRLPHDWAIHTPRDPGMEQGKAQGFHSRAHVGWYRRRMYLKPESGRRYRLRLDGAYRHAELWVNGSSFGVRPSGYATREHDITDQLNADGEQLICVRCDNTGSDGDRWYSGAGLYRRVWLISTAELAVDTWGVCITTPEIEGPRAEVAVAVNLQNLGATCEARTELEILGPEGESVATAASDTVEVRANAAAKLEISVMVENAQRWAPESPRLYTARIRVLENGEAVDELEEPFGIRSFEFTPERGLVFNGEVRKMTGVCLHDDLGCLGTAYFQAGWERRLRTLKELGCNAIRTSHNPPDPAFLDLCDRIGFFVIDEAFDKWRAGVSEGHFDEWWRRDVDALVLRDRNHPSILCWSVGNEVEKQGHPEMIETCAQLSSYIAQLDPTRPTMVALEPHVHYPDVWSASVQEKARTVREISKAVDIVGLNYHDQWYEEYHEAMPETVFVATEAFHFYQHLDNASWALHTDNPWFAVERSPYVAGQFLWTGIDYLGEAVRGWPVRGWQSAMVDSAGFVKPRAYWHAAAWKREPVVSVAIRACSTNSYEPVDWSFPALIDHWNLSVLPEEAVEAWVFANGHSVELFLNEQPMGSRVMSECENRIASFYLPYRPGTLTAVTRDRDGTELARSRIQTAGEPAAVEIALDRGEMRADGQDLCHAVISIVDENGVRVPTAEDVVGVEVLGAARLIGMDNGDLTCREPYDASERSARSGRCLAVIRAGHMAGEVVVRGIVAGLPAAVGKVRLV